MSGISALKSDGGGKPFNLTMQNNVHNKGKQLEVREK